MRLRLCHKNRLSSHADQASSFHYAMLHEISHVEEDGASGRDEHGLSEPDFFHKLGDDAERENDEAEELEEAADSLTHGDCRAFEVLLKRRQIEWKGPNALGLL